MSDDLKMERSVLSRMCLGGVQREGSSYREGCRPRSTIRHRFQYLGLWPWYYLVSDREKMVLLLGTQSCMEVFWTTKFSTEKKIQKWKELMFFDGAESVLYHKHWVSATYWMLNIHKSKLGTSFKFVMTCCYFIADIELQNIEYIFYMMKCDSKLDMLDFSSQKWCSTPKSFYNSLVEDKSCIAKLSLCKWPIY